MFESLEKVKQMNIHYYIIYHLFQFTASVKPTLAKSSEDISFVHVYNNSLKTEIVCKVDSANPNQMKSRWEAQSASCYNSDCTPKKVV